MKKRVTDLLAFAHNPVAFLQQLVEKAKQSGQPTDVISFNLLHQQCYYIGDPELIRQFFAQTDVFRKDSIDFHVFTQTLGHGLLVSQDDLWRNQRRIMQPMFARSQALACAPMITQAAEEMCDEWNTSETIDVWEESKRLTLRVVGEALFSRNPNDDAIGKHFVALEKYIVDLFRVPLPLPKWVPIPANKRLVHAQKELGRVIEAMKKERTAHEREDLLTKLVQAQSDESGSMTNEQVRDEIITLLFAGHETTAAAFTWCCYALATYPDATAKLYSEIDQVLEHGRTPTADDLPRLSYTRSFVEEALRLWPPASFTNRMVKQDIRLGSTQLKKKSLCFVSSLVMQRDERYYSNPEHFQPEHFGAVLGVPEQTGRPTYAYFPFGGGPHVCIGSQFAVIELTLTLATIARRFRLAHTTTEPVVGKMQPSLRPVKLELKAIVRREPQRTIAEELV